MNPGERDWFYVGHYGQLGPLTFEQVEELARDGVITADTYVWSTGMDDWRPAGDVKDLQHRVQTVVNASEPPAFARAASPAATAATVNPYHPTGALSPYGQWGSLPVSDKSRVTAGLLNLIPGVGRLYLGYLAHGVLQILLTLTCGVGIIWSFIDALFILTGGLKTDGYGRVLKD